MKSVSTTLAFVVSIPLATPAAGELTGCVYNGYQRSAFDFGGAMINCHVVDMYLVAGGSSDTLLAVNDLELVNSLGDVRYYQAPSGPEWRPTFYPGTPYDTTAAKYLDSFVSVGGRTEDGVPSLDVEGNLRQMPANGSQLDDAFGPPTTDAPNPGGGWFNGDPLNPVGLAFKSPIIPINSLTIFIGRFSMRDVETFDLTGSLSVTWNVGIDTEIRSGTFNIRELPAPGAGSLGILLGIIGRRRRRC